MLHTDFVLPGGVSLAWTRVYNSRLEGYDDGPLGARWTNEWLVRIDETPERLTYYSPDERSQKCPKPRRGQIYRNLIEGYQLAFFEEGNKLLLSRGRDEKGIGENAPFFQVFEKRKENGRNFYRLMSEHQQPA